MLHISSHSFQSLHFIRLKHRNIRGEYYHPKDQMIPYEPVGRKNPLLMGRLQQIQAQGGKHRVTKPNTNWRVDKNDITMHQQGAAKNLLLKCGGKKCKFYIFKRLLKMLYDKMHLFGLPIHTVNFTNRNTNI